MSTVLRDLLAQALDHARLETATPTVRGAFARLAAHIGRELEVQSTEKSIGPRALRGSCP
ncbi:MAG: hypothetical protein ACLQVI_25735 [Polyangiaceae bacterium]